MDRHKRSADAAVAAAISGAETPGSATRVRVAYNHAGPVTPCLEHPHQTGLSMFAAQQTESPPCPPNAVVGDVWLIVPAGIAKAAKSVDVAHLAARRDKAGLLATASRRLNTSSSCNPPVSRMNSRKGVDAIRVRLNPMLRCSVWVWRPPSARAQVDLKATQRVACSTTTVAWPSASGKGRCHEFQNADAGWSRQGQ
jgi:hypothetical protein